MTKLDPDMAAAGRVTLKEVNHALAMPRMECTMRSVIEVA
jgi:hypothetical protein